MKMTHLNVIKLQTNFICLLQRSFKVIITFLRDNIDD